ncbi:MAG: hypothetical protein IIA73_04305 [Proteobacteria bacterium]|nr:hypothetical protein [Pseudomonadota bacterium]
MALEVGKLFLQSIDSLYQRPQIGLLRRRGRRNRRGASKDARRHDSGQAKAKSHCNSNPVTDAQPARRFTDRPRPARTISPTKLRGASELENVATRA